MIATVFRLELRRSRSLVGWMALLGVAYAGTMSLFYPRMVESSQALQDWLKVFPKEMVAAFGMEAGLTDPGTFFNVYIFSMLWPIMAAIVGILLATRPVAADFDRGFLELSLSTRVSRVRYLLASIAMQILAMIVLAVLTVATILVVGPLIGYPWDAARFSMAALLLVTSGCAIAAVTLLLAVVTLSRATAGGIVAGALVIMYLLHAVAAIEPSLDGLSYLSAFHYLDPVAAIDTGAVPAQGLAVFAVVAVTCWLASLWAFGRRDLLA
jgi:ABC-type transport system involved in multi-copper enzyme maturation permease subunit